MTIKKILFDCGYSDAFLQNAFKLNIDLKKLNTIVFSHGHNDHTGGMYYLCKLYRDSRKLNISTDIPNIIAHPNVFDLKIDSCTGNIGCPISSDTLQKIMTINFTKTPV